MEPTQEPAQEVVNEELPVEPEPVEAAEKEEDVNCRERSINRENKKRAIRHLQNNTSTEDMMIDGTRSTALSKET